MSRTVDLKRDFDRIERQLGGVSGSTAADRSFALIRQAIVELVLQPREPLSDKELAVVLEVSKTPVREALIRLAVEGLVTVMPRSGTFVAPIVADELFEAMIIREALETTAVRLAAQRADNHAKFLLKETMRHQQEAIAARDAGAFHRADDAMHREIVAISDLRRLWALLKIVRVPLSRVRYLAAPVEGRVEMLLEQHQSIVDAILENNADAAVAAMRAHLEALHPFIETLLRSRPDLFAPAEAAEPAWRRASAERV